MHRYVVSVFRAHLRKQKAIVNLIKLYYAVPLFTCETGTAGNRDYRSSRCSGFESRRTRNLIVCAFDLSIFQVKEYEMGGAFSMRARSDKCILNFGPKTRSEETSFRHVNGW
jgi:hypothetical protein